MKLEGFFVCVCVFFFFFFLLLNPKSNYCKILYGMMLKKPFAKVTIRLEKM